MGLGRRKAQSAPFLGIQPGCPGWPCAPQCIQAGAGGRLADAQAGEVSPGPKAGSAHLAPLCFHAMLSVEVPAFKTTFTLWCFDWM